MRRHTKRAIRDTGVHALSNQVMFKSPQAVTSYRPSSPNSTNTGASPKHRISSASNHSPCGQMHERFVSECGDSKTLKDHSVDMMNFLYRMWRSEQMCDVVLKVDGLEIPTHRLALAAHSDRFLETMHEGCVEIYLHGTTVESAHDVIRYIYTSKLNINSHNVDAVLACALELDILSVVDMCSRFLMVFDLETILNFMSIAEKHDLINERKIMNTFVRKQFLNIVKTKAFLSCDLQEVCNLLSDDELCVHNELDVFLGAVTWLDHNRQSRMCYATEVLSAIRWTHITPDDIVTQVEPLGHIMLIPEVKDMVHDSFRYQALHYSGSYLTHAIQTPRKRRQVACQNYTNATYRMNEKPAIPPEGQELYNNVKSEATTSFEISPSLPSPPWSSVILAVGGVNPYDADPDARCSVVDQYNVTSNAWHQVTSLPEARHHHGVVMLDGCMYVIGGSLFNPYKPEDLARPTNTCFRYDPAMNTWFPVASMAQRRMYHGLAVVEGIIYAVGGQDETERSVNSVEYYNPDSDSWDIIMPMTENKLGVATIGYAGCVYVIGGFQKDNDQGALDTVECYDPRTNRWVTKNPLPVPRCHACLTEADGSLYLLGGSTLSKTNAPIVSLGSIIRYNFQDDVWWHVGNLSIPRHDATAVVLDSCLYVIGGVSTQRGCTLSDVECLDTSTNTYLAVRNIDSPALGLACCVITGDWEEHYSSYSAN